MQKFTTSATQVLVSHSNQQKLFLVLLLFHTAWFTGVDRRASMTACILWPLLLLSFTLVESLLAESVYRKHTSYSHTSAVVIVVSYSLIDRQEQNPHAHASRVDPSVMQQMYYTNIVVIYPSAIFTYKSLQQQQCLLLISYCGQEQKFIANYIKQ